jgi:hypothetical protein
VFDLEYLELMPKSQMSEPTTSHILQQLPLAQPEVPFSSCPVSEYLYFVTKDHFFIYIISYFIM